MMNDTGTPAEKVRERLAPRHRPQQDRSRVRFQALLDAAEEMIVEFGLQGLAMRELARRANLPHSSVYHYFPSTTALIRALVERQFEKLSGILETALRARFSRNDAGFSVDQIKSLIQDISDFFFRYAFRARNLGRIARLSRFCGRSTLKIRKRTRYFFSLILLNSFHFLNPGKHSCARSFSSSG